MDLDIENYILGNMGKQEIMDLILFLDSGIRSRDWTKELIQKLVETL